MAPAQRFLTKRDIVAEALRRDILNGTLRPGAQLQQDDIASRLGVSPTPVREAFGALQAEGFLENIPHRGVFVANPSFEDLIDIYEIRGLIEGLALRRAVEKSKDTGRKLVRVTTRAQQELNGGNVERIRRTVNEFHQTMLELAQSPTMTEITGKLVARALFFLPFDLQHMRLVQSDHVAIANAVQQGEIDRAVQLLSEHHRRHAQRLRSLVKENGLPETKPRLIA